MSTVVKLKEETPDVALEEQSSQPAARVEATLQPAAPAKPKRRRGRFALMLALPMALVVGGSYVWVTGGRYQDTENANLRQARVTVASEIPGRIVTVNVADNAAVKAGDVLFAVDPEPYRIALSQADAALEAARLNVEQLRAAYSQAVAQERVAAGEVEYLKSEYDRSTELAGKGISAKSSLDEARRDWQRAEEQHAAAVEGVTSARAALGGDPDIATDTHPTVLAALAAREKAAYSLGQTTVRAPADGVVSQAASFKTGQFVGAGTALFSLVETGDAWIEANFKETQLTHLKPGQKAEVVLDTYPDRAFKATVEAIGAGTGAEFSLLPAQNATGNSVKVTQRIPVRLKLDDADLAMALRTGMSAEVTVDTGVPRGIGALFGHAYAGEAE